MSPNDTDPRPKPPKKESKTGAGIPRGVWTRCPACQKAHLTEKLLESSYVCSQCQHHFALPVFDRITSLTDPGSFIPVQDGLLSSDPLSFVDRVPYRQRWDSPQSAAESVIYGSARLLTMPFQLAVFDFKCMGGSMGVVAGERIARTFDRAARLKTPVVVISASGGARMQEGIFSLLQMSKTAASRHRLRSMGIPLVSILTHPTTGGVAASFASLGDVTLAEPGALIGFAGPRVISATLRQTLPEGFQSSEFLLEHGFVDRIVHRHQLRQELAEWLSRLSYHLRLSEQKTLRTSTVKTPRRRVKDLR